MGPRANVVSGILEAHWSRVFAWLRWSTYGRGSIVIFNLSLILRAGIWPAPKAVWNLAPEQPAGHCGRNCTECLDGNQTGLCNSKNGNSLLATSLSVYAESPAELPNRSNWMNSFLGSFLLPQLRESEPEPILVCLSTGMVTNGSIPARLYAPKTLPACEEWRETSWWSLVPGARPIWPRRQLRSRRSPHRIWGQPDQ